MVNGVEIIGFAVTDATLLDEDTPFGFCSVLTSKTFIGMPLLLVVVSVDPDGFAQMNCCGLKLNCAVLVCTLVDGFIKIFVGTRDTVNRADNNKERMCKKKSNFQLETTHGNNIYFCCH